MRGSIIARDNAREAHGNVYQIGGRADEVSIEMEGGDRGLSKGLEEVRSLPRVSRGGWGGHANGNKRNIYFSAVPSLMLYSYRRLRGTKMVGSWVGGSG
jgi:hypothetical protein